MGLVVYNCIIQVMDVYVQEGSDLPDHVFNPSLRESTNLPYYNRLSGAFSYPTPSQPWTKRKHQPHPRQLQEPNIEEQ